MVGEENKDMTHQVKEHLRMKSSELDLNLDLQLPTPLWNGFVGLGMLAEAIPGLQSWDHSLLTP